MTRPSYDALPDVVRAWVETSLGSAVVTWTSEPGGFSPGVAARLRCADGSRAFLKAVSAEVNPRSPEMHRTEARITAALPASIGSPRLLASYDDGTWVGLLLEEVDGRPPAVPWRSEELAAAFRALDRLAQVPALPELPSFRERIEDDFSCWQRLSRDLPTDLADWQTAHLEDLLALEEAAARAVVGDRLLHLDARGDNMLVRRDGEVVLVDWPWAAAGNPIVDLVCFVPSALLSGAVDAESLLAASEVGRGADPDDVTAVLAAFTGLMELSCRAPAPPGIDTVRAFQAAQARVAGEWLRQRTGW